MASRKRTLGYDEKSVTEKLCLKESNSYISTGIADLSEFLFFNNNLNLGIDRKLSFSKEPLILDTSNILPSYKVEPFSDAEERFFFNPIRSNFLKSFKFSDLPVLDLSVRLQTDSSSDELSKNIVSKTDSFIWNRPHNLNSVIDKVKNLQLTPSVHIYTFTSPEQRITSVDIDHNNSHLAYSPAHSHDIHLLTWDDYSHNFSGNINDVSFKYVATKNLCNKFKRRRMSENSSSPQTYLIHHSAVVTGLRFTPDGNLLLSSSLDGSVKAFSTSNYRIVELYTGSICILDIDVRADSTHFATVNVPFHRHCCECAASLYDLEKTHQVMTFLGHENAIKSVRFHPNGLYIATSSYDGTIRLWSTRSPVEVRNFRNKDSQSPPGKLAFSPDGKHLASTYSGTVKIWDLASGKMLTTLQASDTDLDMLNVCYSASGDILAAGGSNKKINLWNLKSGESSPLSGPEFDLLKCENIDKTIHTIKYTSNFFSCVAT